MRIATANHVHMVAIWTVWYNWVRIHKSLRVTPAMAAEISDRLWSWEEFVALMDEAQHNALLAKRRAMLELSYSK